MMRSMVSNKFISMEDQRRMDLEKELKSKELPASKCSFAKHLEKRWPIYIIQNDNESKKQIKILDIHRATRPRL